MTIRKKKSRTSRRPKAPTPRVTMTLISAGGASAIVPLPTTIQQWWAIIGGYIERVPILVHGGKRATLVVDEEGLIKGLPLNPVASALYGGPIAGPAALLTGTAHKKFGYGR